MLGVTQRSPRRPHSWPVVCAAAGLLACGDSLNPVEIRQETEEGFAQVVRFSDIQPKQGDTLLVVSTIYNLSSSTADVRFWGGCLQVSGTVELERPFVAFQVEECGEWSRPMFAGDSARAWDRWVVRSPPGLYTIRIHHWTDPPVAVEHTLQVKK